MNLKLLSPSFWLAVLTPLAWSPSAAAQPVAPQSGQRVVFLGDSITYGGQYIDYVEAFWRTRFPGRPVEFLNLGLPSETASGLSEPGHAGGKFPRPDVHERLVRVLEQTRPQLVVACYGMNDGIYHPLNAERFERYQQGIRQLRTRVQGAGAAVLHVTPPTFDPLPIKDRTLPAGLEVYERPFVDYNQTLDRFATWLVEQRAQGWPVVDAHFPMNQHLATRRQTQPDFVLARDGVHASSTGHLLIALRLLEAWQVPSTVDAAVVDAASRQVLAGRVRDVVAGPAGLAFKWETRRPMPIDPGWDPVSVQQERVRERFNQHPLTVRGLPAARYRLKEGDRELGTYTAAELAAGIALPAAASVNTGGAELLKLIRQRQKLLTDAWLNQTGHLRPGMAKGLPLAEAQAKAAEGEPRLAALTGPVVLELALERQP